MKRFISLTIAIVMLFALVVVAQAGNPLVADTIHNLSSTAGGDPLYKSTNESQICIFCHTPHGGDNVGPLWNRTPLGGTFTMYTSSTASQVVKDVFDTPVVKDESMLCLTCHDGSVSVYSLMNFSSVGQPNQFGTTDIPVQPGFDGSDGPVIGGSPDGSTFGGKLGDDHPISFSYDAVVTEYAGASKPGLKIAPSDSKIQLFGTTNRVECSTCHNPHDNTWDNFLVVENVGSALCLGCHEK